VRTEETSVACADGVPADGLSVDRRSADRGVVAREGVARAVVDFGRAARVAVVVALVPVLAVDRDRAAEERAARWTVAAGDMRLCYAPTGNPSIRPSQCLLGGWVLLDGGMSS